MINTFSQNVAKWGEIQSNYILNVYLLFPFFLHPGGQALISASSCTMKEMNRDLWSNDLWTSFQKNINKLFFYPLCSDLTYRDTKICRHTVISEACGCKTHITRFNMTGHAGIHTHIPGLGTHCWTQPLWKQTVQLETVSLTAKVLRVTSLQPLFCEHN